MAHAQARAAEGQRDDALDVSVFGKLATWSITYRYPEGRQQRRS